MSADFETAFAKINLALHVRRRRADGYHELETIFAFADDGDHLSVKSGAGLTLKVTGPFGGDLQGDSDNLVLRAARVIQQNYGISVGADLTLDKRLPIASGIGGGSADAAAAARLLNRFWKIEAADRELVELLAPLGADIPACIESRLVRGTGTGTQLTEIDDEALSGMALLLVNPCKPVSTAAIFNQWDGIDRGALISGDALEAAKQERNDLEPIAIKLCPDVADILKILMQQQPLLARMSGSGATCFALFGSDVARDSAASAVSAANPAWWVMKANLR